MNPWSKAFLIALRIFVGWHFLYEGVYKVESDTGSTVYSTSRYAIQGATARLRTFFEGVPPGGLSQDAAFARADAWHDEIVRNFAAQKALGRGPESSPRCPARPGEAVDNRSHARGNRPAGCRQLRLDLRSRGDVENSPAAAGRAIQLPGLSTGFRRPAARILPLNGAGYGRAWNG